jgi:hypothetical protein
MSLLDAFKAKHGPKDGEKLFRSQRKLASASAAHNRTKKAIERRKAKRRQ